MTAAAPAQPREARRSNAGNIGSKNASCPDARLLGGVFMRAELAVDGVKTSLPSPGCGVASQWLAVQL